ncbi:hypothetical protein QM012_006280 [Aureobasidium pullulans]|uniref:Uncharacterized protein n=1 Tax=Aureobasidium pullulans TaxID=5580 RepID=A0ABR0TSJ4_AURPU
MAHQVADQQDATSATSTCSSLSYFSVDQARPIQEQGKWTPRRRHAPPPTLPTHRRARRYDDLFPFEVSQLASVLCHAPLINTPRDGAVWTAYVSHTNQRMALLGPKLRAPTSLPNFMSWSTSHGSCHLHRRLNTKPLEDIFAALRYEAEVRTREVWQYVALAGALSASQTEQLALMDELQSLWLPPSEFMVKFDRLPSPRFAYQTDGCVACILARMGGNLETAMALGALLLGSMRRPDMLSTRVCFCREWVRYTVEGDIDCVDTALADMDAMGTKFRNARKWACQRTKATIEHQNEKLNLDSVLRVQTGLLCRQDPVTTGQEVFLETHAVPEAVERQQGKPASAHQPTPVLDRHEQHYQPLRSAEPQQLDDGSKSQTSQSKVTTSVIDSFPGTNSLATAPTTMINKTLVSSPKSPYSEFTSNPFLDGSSPPPYPNDRYLPPDLPFRLFERRCVRDNDGTPSPPKNAVQWPKQTPLVMKPIVDQFKDNIVPVPILARLDKSDRSVGALWRRRAKRSMASQGAVR